MLNDVRAVKTASIYSVLLSLGGVQVFYVLFNQLDFKQLDDNVDYNVAQALIQLLCDMIEISYNVQIQMINTKGLLAISYALEKVTAFDAFLRTVLERLCTVRLKISCTSLSCCFDFVAFLF